jgi:hypothetical protein
MSFLLVTTGIIHLKNPYQFLQAILGYDLVPHQAATFIAEFLPFFSIVCGISLIFRFLPVATEVFSSILIGCFFVAQLSALLRGLNIDCGCFGSFIKTQISVLSVSIIGLLFCGSIFLFFKESRPVCEIK